jgi:hypothetical protein
MVTQAIVTSYVLNKAKLHSIINLTITGFYTLFTLLFVLLLIKIKNFDQTQRSSYIMKSLAAFLVATSTILQMPVLISIFIVIKSLSLALT